MLTLAANSLEDDQQAFLADGLDALLTKPLLERSVRGIIDRARTRRAERRGTAVVDPLASANVSPATERQAKPAAGDPLGLASPSSIA